MQNEKKKFEPKERKPMDRDRKPMDRERKPMDAEADGLIEGRNAVTEALRAGTAIDKVYIARGETDATLGHIASTARNKGIVVVEADRRKLDGMSRTKSHQGVIAVTAVREYADVEDILAAAREKGEAPLIVVCDELSDPHNLGAVIRTAECAGAHGVIIPKRRSAGLTAIVAKTSAGAVSHLPVARVPNLTALLKDLKAQGLWVYGTAAEGTTTLYNADLKGPAVIIIGSEGDGMGRLVREQCDFLVSIPMRGKVNSLNASAAAAIVLYEAVRQRI
jgi:23S rRNA (guanosine2251-2'-O)-methyltransferase